MCAIALSLISFGVSVPELPESTTAEAARGYLTDNSAALRLFGISMAACAVLLIVVVGQLRSLMAAAEERRGSLRDVAFGAGILCAVWLLVSGSFHAATVFDGIEGLPDEIVLSYYGLMSVGDTLGSASTFAKGALMLAVGLAAVRTRFLPRWLGWLSIVLGAMALGGGLGVVDNPVTGALWYAGLIGFALWPLLIGVTLLVKSVKRA
ncbi:hypothetical protein Rhe02_88660 [Rhizocola hellebori]|uniref:DUF4386 family protein n=1 Tax=Rhizocola hellebori TaxID=1392758 RepID=A0A8J3QGR0_9ACTN|nr:hypothetical protein Rhe02_88660 [Rhizocola hellebori]